MKNNKFKYLIILIFGLFLTGCGFIEQLYCEHDYQETERIEATCTAYGKIIEKCSLCGKLNRTRIEKAPHNYAGEEIVEASCENEGYTIKKCVNCEAILRTNVIAKLPHDLEETVVDATCTEGGYTLSKCKNCQFEEKKNLTRSLGHDLGDWVTVQEATDVADGIKEKQCSRCDYKETEVTLSKSYVDLSVIKEDFDNSVKYNCHSFEELSKKFNAAVLAQSDTLSAILNYECDFDNLLKDLIANCNLGFSLSVKASRLGNEISLTLSYGNIPSLTTPNVKYTQYDSWNYRVNSNPRSEDFDGFKINESIYSYQVSSTDQLHYVLERGVKPVCVEGSAAETVYTEMKKVLRKIISDEMNDVEKVKAIHDYLVMDVTYDNDLLEYLYAGKDDLKAYNGFYLEGVFLNNKAVCEGISKAFTSLCNIEGIPCVTVSGYQTKNPNGAGHAWNKVYVNGSWYIADATGDGTIINGEFEVLNYHFFLTDTLTYQEHYTGENYNEIKCEKKINIFETMNYNYNNSTYDFYITSQEELNTLVKHFESVEKPKTAIQFFVAFDYGTSALDEVGNAYKVNGIYKSYSYVDNGDLFMLFK